MATTRTTVSPPQRVKAGGRIVGTLAAANFVGLLHHLAFSPLLPLIAADLEVGVPLLGQVPAASLLLAGAFGLILGPLADLYGHRPALLVGLLATAVSALGMGLAPGYALLLLFGLVGAIGRASITPVAQAIAGSLFDGDAQRRAIGWVVAGSSLTAVVGVPLLTTIVAATSWRAAFFLLGALALVASVGLLGLPGSCPRAVRGHPVRDVLESYALLLRNRSTLGLVGATLVSTAGFFGLFAYVGAFFAQQHRLSMAEIGWAYSISGLGLLAGNALAAGRLGRAPLRPFLVGIFVARGLLVGAIVLSPLGPAVAVALFTALGFVDGAYFVAIGTVLSREAPGGRGTTMTLNQSAQNLGSAIGSATGGLLLAIGGYPALGLTLPALGLAAAALTWWSGRAPRREMQPASRP
jgi:DHA1 family inner membrane transport protein